MKKRIVIAGAILAAVAALVGWRVWGQNHGNGSVVRLSGNIEMVTVDVSFRIPGRLAQRLVDEGALVDKDKVVAVLDHTDLDRELAQRQAEVQAAQAALDELLAGSRPEEIAQAQAAAEKARSALDDLLAGARPQEIASAEATVARTQADQTNAKSLYDRAVQMRESQFATAKEVDDAKAAYDSAHARVLEAQENLKLVKAGARKDQVEQARSALRQAQEAHALVQAGPRKETIEQARARLAQTQAGLGLAQVRVDDATIHAPIAGMVLAKNAEPGEYLSPGTPVITLGDVTNVYLRAFVSESDLGRVKLGQPAKVKIDGTSRVFEGRVSFISPQAEFTPKNVQTEKERVKLVYRIKVDLPNPDMELKAGMPADAEIMTE
jgi:HlyD family secretion protein